MNAIGGQRPYAWAKTWVNEGHEVDVITITKDQSFDELRDFHVHEVKPLAPFLWLRSFYRRNLKESSSNTVLTPPKSGFFQKLRHLGIGSSTRMPDASDFWILPAIRKARSLGKRWDYVVSTFGPYSTHIVAHQLKKSGHARVWGADFRDLWTLNPYFPGLPILKHFERALERVWMSSADCIFTISGPLAEQMQTLHPGTPTYVVENGADVEEITALKPKPKRRDKFTILYAGTIYPGRRDPTPLLNALVRLAPTNIEVVFAGPSVAELQRIIQQTSSSAYTRILGMIPRADAMCWQQESHVLLFLESNSPDAAGVLTGKLFEYLFSGVEIWGVGVDLTTLSGQMINESGVGEVFGSDEEGLYLALKRLSESGEKNVQLRADYRFKFDRREQAKKVLGILARVGRPQIS